MSGSAPTPGAGPGTVPLGTGEPFAEPTRQTRAVPLGTVPMFQDYPRLVFNAPYFTQNPLAEMFGPAIIEGAMQVIPGILSSSTLIQNAVDTAIQALALLKHGDTATGPIFSTSLLPLPSPLGDYQFVTKAYVDMMTAGGGIGEVPSAPAGEIWARVLGAWIPISGDLGGGTGVSGLPVTGGTMLGDINMGGFQILNLAPVPTMPNGAAPASWVLSEIAAASLYQGIWDAQTNTPNLALPTYQQNGWMWIARTPSTTVPYTILAVIPGLTGQQIWMGDHVIWSTAQAQYAIVRPEIVYLPLDGSLPMTGNLDMGGNTIINVQIDDGVYV